MSYVTVTCQVDPASKALELLVDGELWRTVPRTFCGRKRPTLPKGQVTPEDWQRLFADWERQTAKQLALQLLSRRAYSSYELCKTLRERHVPSALLDDLLSDVAPYLNDTDWIQRFIAAQTQKGQGPAAIRRQLAQKGVPEDIVAAAVRDQSSSESVQETLEYLLRTKYRGRNLADHRDRQKVVASLARRGFPLDAIFAACKAGPWQH